MPVPPCDKYRSPTGGQPKEETKKANSGNSNNKCRESINSNKNNRSRDASTRGGKHTNAGKAATAEAATAKRHDPPLTVKTQAEDPDPDIGEAGRAEGAAGNSRPKGGTRKARSRNSRGYNDAGDLSPNEEWICAQCTFRNTPSAATGACKICRQQRSPTTVSTAGDVKAGPEEIEISSSDADAGDNNGDSDFESASISRKRTNAGASGSSNGTTPRPKKSSRLGAKLSSRSTIHNKTVSIDHQATSSQAKDDTLESENDDDNTSDIPQSSLATNSSRSEPPTTPTGTPNARESDERPGIVSSGSGNWSTTGGASSSSKGGNAGAVIITADCFKLREDLKRRKMFQAGVAATSDRKHDGSYHPNDVDGVDGVGGGAIPGLGEVRQCEAGKTVVSSDVNNVGKPGAKASTKGKGKGKASGGAKLTPMEQQVSDLKAQNPGVLLLVECGYRYRFFGEDALIAAKVLRIYAHVDHNFHVASVPTFRLPVHLRRLVDAGYKVGVVRQAESAALKAAGLTETGKKSGTFKRVLAAVFSQATWVEGAVEALMPASVSQAGGGGSTSGTSGGSSGAGGGKGGQGSWRKIGGAWRRIGGWGSGGREGGGREAGNGGEEQAEEEKTGEPMGEADLDAPLPPVDHARSEQWLLSVYEEDSSPYASSDGEPIAIALALRDRSPACGTGGSGGSEGGALGAGDKDVDDVRVGVVAVDVRTGKVVHDTFLETAGQRRELDTRLRHLKPLELLAPGPRLSQATEATLGRYCDSAVGARGDRRVVRTERLPPEEFCFDAAQASLAAYYGKDKGRGKSSGPATGQATALTRVLDLPRAAICALGPLVAHLERFGLDRSLAAPDLVSFSQSQYMTLDAVTLRDLEVLECQTDGREAGSLFSILNRTQTAFGCRVLAGWVRQPLLSTDDIIARQDAVEELATDPPPVVERLHPALRDLKDLDPAIASLHHRRIQPSRLLSLLVSMRKVFAVFHPPNGATATVGENGGVRREARSSVLLEALAGVPADTASVIDRFLGELDAEAAASDDYVRALIDGESLCKDLASAAEAEDAANVGLEKELQSVRALLRKPSLQWKTLRTGVASTVEYLVELRKSEAKTLAPASWMQVSQTKDLARFHTPAVLRLQQELLQARESRNIAARQAWTELVSQVDEACYQDFRLAVHALGTLDALLSLAAVAKLPGYVRPVYHMASATSVGSVEGKDRAGEGPGGGGGRLADDGERAGEAVGTGDVIALRGARHPTVERVLEGGFVPNDVDLRRGECLVVTGPNMGGKSSTVRMVALLCIMGQMGSYVPADSAELYCLDGVYTRMGAGDDLAADMSTFMVELWHTSYILKHATKRSLVVLDELGRGTSTHDGVAIALATLRHIVRDIGCATLFVTHYPQVADLASDKSLSGAVKNAHMSFIENTATAGTETAEGAAGTECDESSSGGRDNGRVGIAPGVTFLYRLVVGQAHRSYGLNVARAAGMDEEMIKLASKKSAEMRDRSNEEKGERNTPEVIPARVSSSS